MTCVEALPGLALLGCVALSKVTDTRISATTLLWLQSFLCRWQLTSTMQMDVFALNATVPALLQVVLVAEVVPVGTQLVCGLCLLSKDLVAVKPRISIKSVCG